jgi:hypothetical protein
MQRRCKFLLGFLLFAACNRTLGGDVRGATSSAGRGGNVRADDGGAGSGGALGAGGPSSTPIGAGGVGLPTGSGGRLGFGLGTGGREIGAGGGWGSTTGAGGGSGLAPDAASGTADASAGGDGGAPYPFCAIPSAPAQRLTNITVSWCDAAQTCAQCSWVATEIGGTTMPTGPCALPPLLCPSAASTSGPIAAGGVFPLCTAHPDGETYEGLLVQLIGTTLVAPSVTVATSCSGLDNEGAGNLPVFGFDVTPCAVGRPTCVARCSDCP